MRRCARSRLTLGRLRKGLVTATSNRIRKVPLFYHIERFLLTVVCRSPIMGSELDLEVYL